MYIRGGFDLPRPFGDSYCPLDPSIHKAYPILDVHNDVFEEPIEGGNNAGFFVFFFANVEDSGVIEEEFPPFAREAFASRVGSREIVARRPSN